MKNIKNISISNEFLAWLVGFIDAEGCFYINRKTMSNGNIRYAFGLKIKLHKDQVDLLKFIHDTLGIGWLEKSKNNTCCFHVDSERELRHLIGLLDNTTLMGIKYLDYISFKEAFFLYFNRTGLVTESLQVEIEKIRANHNTKRTLFEMPENFKRIITDYKLLGLIEGDGCFFLQKKGLTPRFELELTFSQKPLLVAIKAYLESKFGLSNIQDIKGGIRVRDMKAKSNSKPRARLEIIGIDLLHNYFNVFLKNLVFFSSKGKDFEEFVFICETLFKRTHLNNPEIHQLLLNRAGGMNNARLSTNKKSVTSVVMEEVI